MINQTEKKEELIRSFNNLIEFKHYKIKDEEKILSILDKLSTSLFGTKYDYCSSPEYSDYCSNNLKKELKREKDQALISKILITGTL